MGNAPLGISCKSKRPVLARSVSQVNTRYCGCRSEYGWKKCHDVFQMDVIVSDGMKSDSAVLIVRVLNTSSIGNVIRFSKANYEASVAENVTSSVAVHLFTVSANSSGKDGLLYSMLNQNKYFTIGATSGLVSWTGVLLDREQTPTVQFIVQVRPLNFILPV